MREIFVSFRAGRIKETAMDTVYLTPEDSISETLKKINAGTRILLAPGVYREKLEITVSDTEFVGSGASQTRIVWDDYAKKPDEKGVEFNTFRTYTAAVLAPRVTFRDLAVENDALYPETKGQEVALSICADEFFAENCRFVSTQDTLFCGPLPTDLIIRYYGFLKDALRAGGNMRQVFKNCFIAGNVDFIFGCGNALFKGCEIRSVYDVRGCGYAAAPAHSHQQKIGFVFENCRFTCDDGVEDGSVYLARPWRDHGKCSFICCKYGRHISAEGFDEWNGSGRDKTARFYEYGDLPEGRVMWSRVLTEEERVFLKGFFENYSAGS